MLLLVLMLVVLVLVLVLVPITDWRKYPYRRRQSAYQ
jgi:hypothetical protein